MKKVVNYKKILLKFKTMSSICEAISKLHKSGNKPWEIFRILKPCVTRTGVYMVLKCIGETGSPLPRVRSTPKCPVRTPQWCQFSIWPTFQIWPTKFV